MRESNLHLVLIPAGFAILFWVPLNFLGDLYTALAGTVGTLVLGAGIISGILHYRSKYPPAVKWILISATVSVAAGVVFLLINRAFDSPNTSLIEKSTQIQLLVDKVERDGISARIIIRNQSSSALTVWSLKAVTTDDGAQDPRARDVAPNTETQLLLSPGLLVDNKKVALYFYYTFENAAPMRAYAEFLLPPSLTAGSVYYPSVCCESEGKPEIEFDPAFQLTKEFGHSEMILSEKNPDGSFADFSLGPPDRQFHFGPSAEGVSFGVAYNGQLKVLLGELNESADGRHQIHIGWTKGAHELAIDGRLWVYDSSAAEPIREFAPGTWTLHQLRKPATPSEAAPAPI
ncbi:MAG TPA: hypothetical protein VMZ30_10885 [Pyrinomonadaceae bacterium]|nr:hypothetical protein [Pyrinomonadaceae bacterium]